MSSSETEAAQRHDARLNLPPPAERAAIDELKEELRLSRALSNVAVAIGSELDRRRLVQVITDEATSLCAAQFGAFFENVERPDGGSYMLYTLSGAPREAFESLGQPRATPVFAPTFRGDGPVRSSDITKDPRYGTMDPHRGMPRGHLPVRSYLAVPVITAAGKVLGGLFFGHPEPDRFQGMHERAVVALAGHAAIALENATLFQHLATTRAALHEHEQRLRLALAAGRMGAWEYDLRAGRVHWSPEIERIHGIAVGSFDGTFESYQRDIHPDDRERVLGAVAQNLKDAREHHLLYRIVRPDGAVRWLEAFGQFVFDADGKPERLIGVCSDVSERVASESTRGALRIQRILEGISDPFTVYDEKWTILFTNSAGSAYLKLRPEDLVGRNAWELFPEIVGSRFQAELLRVAEARQAASFEDYFAPLGRWFEVHAYPVPELGIAVYSRDVTARHNEQALRERLVQYGELRADVGAALASRSALEAILQACCEAIVTRLGMSFARVWLLDASGETLVLRASAGKYTHTDGPHSRVPVGAFKIGKIASERTPHLTNDVQHDPRVGDPEWAAREGIVAFAGYPLLVDDRLIGVMGAFSRQALPEDTLDALGSVSDAIAQGIERQRAQVALEEHARELARSNTELEQFAYVASHDLQEPLRMVTSYVQLLARRYKDELDADARDFIGYAVEGVTRMRSLIDDLLAYSRVGTRAREAVPVDLGSVLDVALKNLERALEESAAIVTRGDLTRVLGDQRQLEQLLQNLIGNAIKFRGEEPPRIHVDSRLEGGHCIVSVQDNGIGIDAQYFERIFVIFQRLNPRERYPGTGMGLAIAKKIVERHGGRIWVESSPGRGSTLFFSLPSATNSQRTAA